MKLIVGLGNPGKEYEKTRHNIGFMVVDAFHKTLSSHDISGWELSKKFNAQIAGCVYQKEKILLAKPMTFMNESGQSVGLIAHYYHILPKDIIVVHDEKDIPLGEIKIQENRGDAGHNGVKSITQHLGSKAYTRIRIGVAAKNKRKMKDTAAFVLGRFGLLERPVVDTVMKESIIHIEKLIQS